MKRILLVDDDLSLLKLTALRLRSQAFMVVAVDSAEAALEQLRQQAFDVVLTDLCMAGMDGLALFERIAAQWPRLPVIIMTAHGTIPDALAATRAGVFGFLTKPVDKVLLFSTLEQACQMAPDKLSRWQAFIQTRNPVLTGLLAKAQVLAKTETPILLLGPSGSGKRQLARALHQGSGRHAEPLHLISCAATARETLDRQLFSPSEGLFATAHGATLFLDEIASLSGTLQAKLAAALEGPLSVRLICASHVDLAHILQQGRLREDLYYRLTVSQLTLPALCERREDVPLLARQFLLNYRQAHAECAAVDFAPEALTLLAAADWPGNVRQLRSMVEQLASLCSTPLIGPPMVESALSLSGGSGEILSFNEARAEFEREYLLRLLRTTEGNVTVAATMADRNRTDFYKLLKRHGIEAANFKLRH
ncbi:MAG: sigma 54-interacting transcriptional regulator [Aeromonas sp.]